MEIIINTHAMIEQSLNFFCQCFLYLNLIGLLLCLFYRVNKNETRLKPFLLRQAIKKRKVLLSVNASWDQASKTKCIICREIPWNGVTLWISFHKAQLNWNYPDFGAGSKYDYTKWAIKGESKVHTLSL